MTKVQSGSGPVERIVLQSLPYVSDRTHPVVCPVCYIPGKTAIKNAAVIQPIVILVWVKTISEPPSRISNTLIYDSISAPKEPGWNLSLEFFTRKGKMCYSGAEDESAEYYAANISEHGGLLFVR